MSALRSTPPCGRSLTVPAALGDPVVVTTCWKGPNSIWTVGNLADTPLTRCVEVNVASDEPW